MHFTVMQIILIQKTIFFLQTASAGLLVSSLDGRRRGRRRGRSLAVHSIHWLAVHSRSLGGTARELAALEPKMLASMQHWGR
jgi:hypothetical protein